jgi:NADPH-dependent 7-cyano-7-deazaguanine reductase QueF
MDLAQKECITFPYATNKLEQEVHPAQLKSKLFTFPLQVAQLLTNCLVTAQADLMTQTIWGAAALK